MMPRPEQVLRKWWLYHHQCRQQTGLRRNKGHGLCGLLGDQTDEQTTNASVSVVPTTEWTSRHGGHHHVVQLGQLSGQKSTLLSGSGRDVWFPRELMSGMWPCTAPCLPQTYGHCPVIPLFLHLEVALSPIATSHSDSLWLTVSY